MQNTDISESANQYRQSYIHAIEVPQQIAQDGNDESV